jgi:hypothetical protein
VNTRRVNHRYAVVILALVAALFSTAGALAQAAHWRITPSDLRGGERMRKNASHPSQLGGCVAGLHEGTPGYELMRPAYSYTLNCGGSWSLPYQQRFGNEKTLRTLTAYLDTFSVYRALETINVRSREKPVYRCRAPIVPLPTADWELIGSSIIVRTTERGTTIEDARSGKVLERGVRHVSGGEFSDGSVVWLEVPPDPSSGERPHVVHWKRGREPRQIRDLDSGEMPRSGAVAFESHNKKWLLVEVSPETRGTEEPGLQRVWITNVATGDAALHSVPGPWGRLTACQGGVLCVGMGVRKFAYDGVALTLVWQLQDPDFWELIAWSPDHRLAVLQVAPGIRADTMTATGDRVVAVDTRDGSVLTDFDPEGDCSHAGALLDAKNRLHLIPRTDLVDLVYEID